MSNISHSPAVNNWITLVSERKTKNYSMVGHWSDVVQNLSGQQEKNILVNSKVWIQSTLTADFLSFIAFSNSLFDFGAARCACKAWIWFTWRRKAKYNLERIIVMQIKQIFQITRSKTWIQLKVTAEIKIFNTHSKIATPATRLDVTSSWYLRWSWTARNLSTLRAMTPRNEVLESTYKIPLNNLTNGNGRNGL